MSRDNDWSWKPPKKTQGFMQVKRKRKKRRRFKSDGFFRSDEWIRLRYQALVLYGARCQCCGASAKDEGVVMNVDHIKSRSKFPHLALDISNLQVLCRRCNHGKGWHDETDWRELDALSEDQRLHLRSILNS